MSKKKLNGKRFARLERSLFKNENEVEIDDDEADEDGTWTQDETVALMKAIKKQLKERDTFSYVRRIQLLDWEQVKIDGKTALECKSRLGHLIKKIRHVRTLGEILSDVDIERIDVRKPKSAYALFCEEMKNEDLNGNNFFKEASKRFKNLPAKKKAYYERESRKQSQIYKKQCPNGTRNKRMYTTPFALFCMRKNTKECISNKAVLRKQYAALTDTEKLEWIQKAVSDNVGQGEDDTEKYLNKDEQSILKGEPKQPLNAFNLFIKIKSAEGVVDFKSATQAYRRLSKEQKDEYIQMARKAKIQYKHDLASYLFSMPPEEQKKYLNKLPNPKGTRTVKKTVKPENDELDKDDDLDEIDDDSENDLLDSVYEVNHVIEDNDVNDGNGINDGNDVNDGNGINDGNVINDGDGMNDDNGVTYIIKSSAPMEIIASSTPMEIIEASTPIEIVESSTPMEIIEISKPMDIIESPRPMDVSSIKMENSFGEPSSNINLEPSSSKSKSTVENPKIVAAISKSTNKNLKVVPTEPISCNEIDVIEVESQLQTSRKTSSSKKRKPDENDDDKESSISSSISQKSKEKSLRKKRRMEETEACSALSTQIKQEFTEPERISSKPYHYWLKASFTGKHTKAKKIYMKMGYSEKRQLKKEHKRRYKDYLKQLEEYCDSLVKKELQDFAERMQQAEEDELETSDPDDY